MEAAFYIVSFVAILATVMVITRRNAVHALLYLIVSLLAVAVIFFLLGAPFIAALEVIIYAGAIMVLFIFVIMMLNLGPRTVEQERQWQRPGMWIGPLILFAVLMGELIYAVAGRGNFSSGGTVVQAQEVGSALFGPYLVGVQLAAMLLLAGLVGAYHLGRGDKKKGS